MLDWYAKALDLPPFFLSKSSNPESVGGGAIQGSASDAIFSCMFAARARAIKKLKGTNYNIHDSVFLPMLVCYTSKEAHSSVEKAAMLNLVKMRVIEPDSHDSMRGAALEKMIQRDVERGLTPFFVVGTVGTTSQVAFDNLVEIGTRSLFPNCGS
jgi:tyrosine decarboxylase